MRLLLLAVIMTINIHNAFGGTSWSLIKPPATAPVKIPDEVEKFKFEEFDCEVSKSQFYKTGEDHDLVVEYRDLKCTERKSKVTMSTSAFCPGRPNDMNDAKLLVHTVKKDAPLGLIGLGCIRTK